MRDKILRIMLVISVAIGVFTVVSFIYFIDQLPASQTSTTFQLTMKHIDYGNGSFIINRSLTWMYFFLGFNILTLGLAVFFFKPKEQKLIELALYNVIVSGLFFVGLFLYVSMFPEVISSAVDHKFLHTVFFVEGDPFKAVNIMYVLLIGYFAQNIVFLSLSSEK